MFHNIIFISIFLAIPLKVLSQSQGSEVCSIFWASSSSVRVIEIGNRTVTSDKTYDIGDAIGSIAWDAVSSKLMWFDLATNIQGSGYLPFLAAMDLKSGLPTEVWKIAARDVKGISFDWNSGNYFAAGQSHIYVFRAKYRPDPSEYYKSRVIRSGASINDVVVHPGRGYLFWSQYSTSISNYVVMRSGLDGSNPTEIISRVRDTLALDVRHDILYVHNGTSIVATDLHGGSLRVIQPTFRNITKLYMDSKVLDVWGDGIVVEYSGTLLYVDPATAIASEIIRKEPGTISQDIKVYCPSMFPVFHTPCVNNNGGCGSEQICLHNPSGGVKCHANKRWL